jgi:hypothetical protein
MVNGKEFERDNIESNMFNLSLTILGILVTATSTNAIVTLLKKIDFW